MSYKLIMKPVISITLISDKPAQNHSLSNKKRKMRQIGKKIKLSMFVATMILYLKEP